MSGRRRTRSASTSAGKVSSRKGRNWAARNPPTSPLLAPSWSSATNGRASSVISLPSWLTVWPTQ